MLATRQKADTVSRAIRSLLVSGIYPTLAAIYDKVRELAHDRRWGQPLARLRPAVDGQPIGGPDGRDIERTYAEMRADLTTYFHELVDSADKALANYWMFLAGKGILQRRALHVIQSSESVINTFASGGAVTFVDTFNTAELVELGETTAQLDLEAGYVTLPVGLNSLEPLPIARAAVVGESYPNAKPHGQIMDALTDASNTGWYASLGGETYTCVLRLSSVETARTANGLYVSPLAPMRVRVSWSNDLHNFYQLADEEIRQERTWLFAPTRVAAIRLEVTGTDVGIRRLKLMKIGHEDSAVLHGVPLVALDMFGRRCPVDSVRLHTEEDCPPKSRIDYFVRPIYESQPAGDWIKLSYGRARLSASSSVTYALDAAYGYRFTPESDTGLGRPFYRCSVHADPIVDTSRLVKGGDPISAAGLPGRCGQFVARYYEHDWAAASVDPNHSPTPADWADPGATSRGYLRPANFSLTSLSHDPVTNDDLSAAHSAFVEATLTPGTSDADRDYLCIGVIDKDGHPLLAANGNYHFTAYVYMPADMVVSRKPCVLYNPTGRGGSGEPVIAPFRVYLNGELVADVRKATSVPSLAAADLTAYEVSYAYRRGWNRFEIYVYRTDAGAGTGPVTDRVADGSIGIYIGGNPYQLARANPAIYVQANSQDEKRVSEFALRQLIKPGDESCWAWTDTAPERDILLNYDPADTSGTFDGYTSPEAPVMILTYQTAGEQRPIGLIFRAQFSREADAIGVPKLAAYKLVVNQTGA